MESTRDSQYNSQVLQCKGKVSTVILCNCYVYSCEIGVTMYVLSGYQDCHEVRLEESLWADTCCAWISSFRSSPYSRSLSSKVRTIFTFGNTSMCHILGIWTIQSGVYTWEPSINQSHVPCNITFPLYQPQSVAQLQIPGIQQPDQQ